MKLSIYLAALNNATPEPDIDRRVPNCFLWIASLYSYETCL